MPEQMKTVHFHCKTCNEWNEVKTMGVVLQGPRCPRCKKPMREVTLEQGELRLSFDEEVRD